MFISVRIDRSVIRVKAMLIAPNLEHTAHAVTLNAPTVENPRGFHRLIGGNGDDLRRVEQLNRLTCDLNGAYGCSETRERECRKEYGRSRCGTA